MSMMRVRLERFESGFAARAGRLTRGGRPSWEREADILPWLDRADAPAHVAEAPGLDRERLEHWVRDGYLVLNDVIPAEQVDALADAMDSVWVDQRPRRSLVIRDLRREPGAALGNLSHADLLALDPRERERVRAGSRWRIHEFEAEEKAAARIFVNPELRRLASVVLGRPSRPVASISFMYGSEQALHQDMAVFHVWPRNHILGAWVACEDIEPGCGPLVFYPGSHREPMFEEFDRYPETNLHTADDSRAQRYQAWIDGLADRYERKEFLARKGQVLLWHSMLFHGGSPVTVPEATRRSFVIHFAPRGALLHHEWAGARW